MSLEYAILGFLHHGSCSGYDLKAMFDLSVRHFWPADQSQIYRTLGQMEGRGWVRMKVIEQADRPDRKLYHLTEEGAVALRQWLTLPLEAAKTRNAHLIQLFFAGQLTDEELLAILRGMATQARNVLEVLTAIMASRPTWNRLQGTSREQYCWLLTLECGLHMTQAYLAWIESVIGRIERGELPAPREGTTCAV